LPRFFYVFNVFLLFFPERFFTSMVSLMLYFWYAEASTCDIGYAGSFPPPNCTGNTRRLNSWTSVDKHSTQNTSHCVIKSGAGQSQCGNSHTSYLYWTRNTLYGTR